MERSKPNTGPVASTTDRNASPAEAADAEVAAFAAAVRALGPKPQGAARLIFALDATMSRQPTWDAACTLQARLFEAAAKVGGLQVQLVYFRGVGETRASRWLADPAELTRIMSRIACQGGETQLRKVLLHAERQASAAPVSALVYVGDCLEEAIDPLCAQAAALRLLGVRAFMFHEGADPAAARGFREIARITGGVYLPFAPGAAEELGRLLGAVGAWAAGGRPALERRGDAASRLLLGKLG